MTKIAILFAAICLLSVSGAQGKTKDQCPERPAAERRASRWAGKWFQKGSKAAKNGNFERALDRFLCSLYLKPHENTVFNIAQLTNLVEDKETAANRIKQFREENTDNAFDGELEDLVVSLEISMGIRSPEPPETEPTAPTIQDEGPGEPRPAMKTAGYALLGTAGATLLTAIVFQAAAGASKNDAEESITYGEFTRERDSMKKRQTGATVMFVATAILAGTGAWLLALNKKDEKEAVTDEDEAGGVELSVLPSVGGVALSGSF